MSVSQPRQFTDEDYDRSAREYFRSLMMEDYMESTRQSVGRMILLAALEILKEMRGGFEFYSELLIQYIHDGQIWRVTPDTFVVIGAVPDRDRTYFAVEKEPLPPLVVFEPVSPSNEKKDYEGSFRKYEQELEVPYCVLFHTVRRQLQVFHLEAGKYVQLEPGAQGRVAIGELEIEIGVLDGWMRLWHDGKLLPAPAELHREVTELAEEAKRRSKQLASRKEEVIKLQARVNDAIAALRKAVIEMATASGRSDIADRASASSDAQQMKGWLSELLQAKKA